MSKSGKNLEARLHSIRALNPRPDGKFTKSLPKTICKFKVSELVTSVSTSYPGFLAFTIVLVATRVFFVVTTIGKRRDPGVSPDRQFLISKENKKRIY